MTNLEKISAWKNTKQERGQLTCPCGFVGGPRNIVKHRLSCAVWGEMYMSFRQGTQTIQRTADRLYFCGFLQGMSSVPLFDYRRDEALKYRDAVECAQMIAMLRDQYGQDCEVGP